MLRLDKGYIPPEDKLLSSWCSDEVKVSVLCICYNHEKYLSQAIESFLVQETDFAFEIVIHDDASSDRSAEIIAYYHALYPKIIKPIYQSENQYSKAPNSVFVIGAERCKSNFIAICEGDDYWFSKDKLQKQYMALRSRKDINLSFHSYKTESGRFSTSLLGVGPGGKVVSLDKMIVSGPTFVALSSVMIKKKTLINSLERCINMPIGDLFIQLYGSYPNGSLYVGGLLSYYRVLSEGSWSRKASNFGADMKFSHWIATNKGLDFFDEDTALKKTTPIAFAKYYRAHGLIEYALAEKDQFFFNKIAAELRGMSIPGYIVFLSRSRIWIKLAILYRRTVRLLIVRLGFF
ncbi:glycosyltransferase family A protein [Alcanivorax sp.]|jgi:glycosyltransferase involved in cell wall biosynthesis|uniref:glycosyltransferase family 2 protein n=1 Tax=Alcanivorax sp. TaxID=1872427 RepID=UPI0032D91414